MGSRNFTTLVTDVSMQLCCPESIQLHFCVSSVSLVNKAVVDYFFVDLGVERHFEALRHFLLMEDGEFAQSLSDLLFEKVGNVRFYITFLPIGEAQSGGCMILELCCLTPAQNMFRVQQEKPDGHLDHRCEQLGVICSDDF